MKIETIHPYPFPPWAKPVGTLHNLNKSKEETIDLIPKQLKEEEEKNSIIIFTDGSVNQEGGGASAVSNSNHKTLSLQHPHLFSNHETEILGLSLAAQLAKDSLRGRTQSPPDVAIFSDNQGVLKLIHDIPSATSGQHLIIRTRLILTSLPTDATIRWYWTPGHAGIELNERADELAKQAANAQTSPLQLPASLGSLKRLTKNRFNAKCFPFRPGSKTFSTKPQDIAKALMVMEKGRAAAIVQLRAGHSPLNDHLFKRNISDSPLCSKCKLKETTEHFLLYCSRYKNERKRFRSRLREEEIRVNWNNAKKLLDSPKAFFLLSEFILETKRFVFFISYTQDSDSRKQSRSKS
jgi:ribonuclease HI